MRPGRVVFLTEVFNDHPSLGQGPELFPVETLVPEAAVEAFHEAIFPRVGRGDVDGLDLLVGQPALEIVGDKLRAVVGAPKTCPHGD